MKKWTKIEDFRDDVIIGSQGGERYELVIDDELGDVDETEAEQTPLPSGELPSHVWSSGGRWLAE